MKDVPLLARWLFPSTITTLENKIELLKKENYRIKRENAQLKRDFEYVTYPPPSWSFIDWEQAYGETKYKT